MYQHLRPNLNGPMQLIFFSFFTMAKLVTEERLLELKETFSLYDKDMNGSISTEELSMVC